MKTQNYTATSRLSQIGKLQEAAELQYSATYEAEDCCSIRVSKTKTDHTVTEKFKCNIAFDECVGLITLFKENCMCPSHCKDVASDLGYVVYAV